MNRLVAWFVDNPIAANLLMILILFGGLTVFEPIDKQFFPERIINQITVSVNYPGAGPAEVEKQIVVRIEEAVDDLDGIEELRAVAREGLGEVTIEVITDYDSQKLLNEVKSRIDAINTFPVEAERPQVVELAWKSRMISVALAADIDEASLKELGERLREEIAELPNVALVELRSPRAYEMSIEVSEYALRRYGLRFDDVVAAVRDSSLNLPAGKIRTEGGDIQVQTRAQGYTAADFERIVLIRKRDGAQVLLGDVARVVDGFEEIDVLSSFNGKPSLALDVYVTTNPDVLKTSAEVSAYIEQMRAKLPESVELVIWRDASDAFKGRLATLVSNGIGGLALVFVILLLFLRPLLAFWVCVGIAVAFLGAFWLLPLTGTGLNMVTLFAFILILGIVVDDAIIVAESVYTEQQKGLPPMQAAVTGTQGVMVPVWFAVISTMIFFAPLLYVSKEAAEPAQIPKVVLLALAFSLLESMFILPSHLAKMKPERPTRLPVLRTLQAVRARFATGMETMAQQHYRSFLARCLDWRGMTIALFLVTLLSSIALMAGGWLGTSFFPKVPVDYLTASATLPEGGAFAETYAVKERLESSAERIKRELNSGDKTVIGSIEAAAYTNTVRVTMEISDYENSDVDTEALRQQWLGYIGELPMAEEFDIVNSMFDFGKPIEFRMSAPDVDKLRAATARIREALARYPGVFNISDTLENPRPEIELRLKPEAETLELTLADVARQVRRGFYGEEVQRIPRLREDVKVMVRYPESERRSEDFLRDMRIRTPSGVEVPFETVAEISYVPSYREIERIDRKRVATVSADIRPGTSEAGEVMSALARDFVPQLKAEFPRLTVDIEGEQRQRGDFLVNMQRLMLVSIILIFGLMAIAFRSYFQPLIILTAIPYGVMGAFIGHLVLGLDVSMFSLMGIIAAAGVVVNDNLVLVDRINKLRAEGMTTMESVTQAAVDRFRPIILTSMTTFIGLTPIMLERSIQAQFLIPMVVSLAFGVLFATVVTLLLVPCVYLVAEKAQTRLQVLWQRLGAKAKALLPEY